MGNCASSSLMIKEVIKDMYNGYDNLSPDQKTQLDNYIFRLIDKKLG